MNKNIKIIITVIVISVLLLLLYWAYQKLYQDCYLIINQPEETRNRKDIYDGMTTSVCNKGISWTYNFWLYLDDWKYNFGKKKFILSSSNVTIWLDPKTPNLHIQLNVFNKDDKHIIYKDVPLQKWLNIVIILDNRNIDVFINKYLYKSLFLDTIPEQHPVNEIILFGSDSHKKSGFSGYISQLKYFSYNIDRPRVDLEYYFGYRGLFYKFFITRIIYKLYLFLYKTFNPKYSNISSKELTNLSCG